MKAVPPELGRRRFLKLAVAAANVAACGPTAGPESVGDVGAGNVSGLAVGSVVALQGVAACIARDGRGVYAMTLTCTHQGCDMGTTGSVSASAIECGCHGSVFDANGNVLRGPAQTALTHYAVSMDAQGNLTVHGGTTVDSSTRLAAP
jgi:Rieske Fe-S protein